MVTNLRCWVLVLGVLALAGCSTNPNRWPFMRVGDPAFERRAYETHDPLPDRLNGPETAARPRGFEIQRTEPRRIRERANAIAAPPGAVPQYPQQTSSYPNTVTPE